ncbi:MAG: hypothetical protein H7Z37_02885 [Pyrinomonadaceae bacterium]|nr:hypothetical protein [Pyrinomonadaceae bacterium]
MKFDASPILKLARVKTLVAGVRVELNVISTAFASVYKSATTKIDETFALYQLSYANANVCGWT